MMCFQLGWWVCIIGVKNNLIFVWLFLANKKEAKKSGVVTVPQYYITKTSENFVSHMVLFGGW